MLMVREERLLTTPEGDKKHGKKDQRKDIVLQSILFAPCVKKDLFRISISLAKLSKGLLFWPCLVFKNWSSVSKYLYGFNVKHV